MSDVVNGRHTGAEDWQYYWDQLTRNGELNPLGDSGINVEGALAGYRTGRSNGRVDPRLYDFGNFEQVGSEAGSDTMQFTPGDQRMDTRGILDGNMAQVGDMSSIGHDGRIIDYRRLQYDPKYGIVNPTDNFKRDAAAENGDLGLFIAGGAVLGGATAAHALSGAGAASAGEAGAGLDAIQAGENVGSVLNAPGGMYSPPDSYWNMTADSGGYATDATSGGWEGLGDGGGLDPETWAGNGGMSVNQNGLGSWNALPNADRLAGLAANPSSALSSTGMPAQMAQGGLQSIANNPRQALQLANLVSSMGGMASGGGEGGGNGPSELGSMGWKLPEFGAYQSAVYDPRYGSPYKGWQEQYAASRLPISAMRRMYGNG